MSASNDRRDGMRLPMRTRPMRDDGYPHPQLEPTFDSSRRVAHSLGAPADARHGPPSQTGAPTAQPVAAHSRDDDRTFTQSIDMHAGNRDDITAVERRGSSIVPAQTVTGRSLALVVGIMCFFACLTSGAVYLMNQSATAWLHDIASEVTVQIQPGGKGTPEQQVAEVVAFLRQQPGLSTVRALTLDDSVALLEPWLGHAETLRSLPVPRLVAIELDRAKPARLPELEKRLADRFKGVGIDDHRRWRRQIRTVTGSFALGGLGILFLVAAATTAIIVSATKSAMASNREIVEVLHFVGATDRFIAREFERHFLRLGVKSGLVGALLAMLVFFAMPHAMELLGGGTVSAVELKRLVGSGGLDPVGYLLLAIVVVIIAGLCMLTSRLGVYSILRTQH